MKNSRIQNILLNDYSEPFDVTKKICPHYQTVLNFWLYVENLDEQQILTLCEKSDELWEIEDWSYYYQSDFWKKLEKDLVNDDNDFLTDACCDYAYDVCKNYSNVYPNVFADSITSATKELILMDYLLEKGQELVSLKLFDNL